MRTNFAISADGHIFFPEKKPSSHYVVFAERRAHALRVSIKPNCAPIALITLLQHIRDVKGTILIESTADQKKKLIFQTADACVYIGQLALQYYEQTHHEDLNSKIEPWSDSMDSHSPIPGASTLTEPIPEAIALMAKMRLGDLDTATALTYFTEQQMQDVAFLYPDASRHLHIGKLPQTLQWPCGQTLLDISRLDWIDAPYGIWLRLVAEIALASRRPLLHYGHIKGYKPTSDLMNAAQNTVKFSDRTPQENIDFIRLLYPLAADREKPNNYRLITLAYSLPDMRPIL